MTDDVGAAWRRLAADHRVGLLGGFHPVQHALRLGAGVLLRVPADRAGMLELAARLAPDLTERLAGTARETDERTLRALTGSRLHTNVAALARRPAPGRPGGPSQRTGPTVLLFEPRHLGNVGAVVRVAAGLRPAARLTTGELEPRHPDAIPGSAGLHFPLPAGRIAGLTELGGPLPARGPARRDAREVTLPGEGAVAVGSERCGLPAAIRDRAADVAAIPMRDLVSSYNLATSVAMLLYQWRLQAGGGR